MKIHLLRNMTYLVENPGHGLMIECVSGIFWITQAYDREDYILTPGEKFAAAPKGRIVVQGLRDGWVSVGEREEHAAA